MNKTLNYFKINIKKNNLSDKLFLTDFNCWINYKKHNWIYNKLELAQMQNLTSAPWPIIPKNYPVIIKPIINLLGMSRGFKIIYNIDEFVELKDKDGYFWEEYLDGKQINLDLIILNGTIIDYFAVYSEAEKDGSFTYHKYLINYKLNEEIKTFIYDNFKKYKGFLNLETINDKIIEGHLRLNGDYFIYNKKIIDNFINFYITENYKKNIELKEVFFFPVFISKDINVKNIKNILKKICIKYKKYIIDYEFDNFYSDNQNFETKRILVFTSYKLKYGNRIKDKINELVNSNN
jgi:hypothetical protein|tara:strand:- start:103 stop:978 length:876 start_codon:yes stop_codon:yes gene_type:complete